MTNDIAHILSSYEGQDFKTILSSSTLERDIALIGQHIDTAQGNTSQAEAFLLRLINEIDIYAETLKTDQTLTKESMDSITKMADACIAYTQPRGGKKG